jgi:hypothetical protein
MGLLERSSKPVFSEKCLKNKQKGKQKGLLQDCCSNPLFVLF